MPPISAAHLSKVEIRRLMRQRRRALTFREQEKACHNIVRSLRRSTHFQHSRHVAVYLTNDAEISTEALIKDLQQRGKTLYLPVLHPLKKGHLSFLRFDASTPMVRNRFGILEPDFRRQRAMKTRFLPLICLPLVAFDAQGNRLGMGGGFYDRTLSSTQTPGQTPKLIGCAYALQQVEKLPAEPWDIALSAIATDTTLHQW